MANTINADNGVISGITGIRTTADNTGNLALQTNGNTVLTLATNNTATFANNVTISGALTATGGISGNTTFANATTFSSTATATAFIPSGSTVPSTGLYSPSANSTAIASGSAAVAIFDSVGNLQYGYNGSSPTAATAPQGISMTSNASVALQIYMLKQTQVECHIGYKSGTDTNLYIGTSGGGGPGGIGAYGVYQQNVTNSWTSVSDERVKTELEPIENALEKVANVRTVTGRFIYDEENGVTRRLPFLIAQDFLEALPEAVDQQDPNKLGLSYTDTIVLAFAAIKELKAEVDELKQKLA